jgi:hypothetical protein
VNKKCNGHFLDLFEPIENIEFTENDSNIDVQWEPYSDFGSKEINIYKEIKPLPKIKKQVHELRKKMKKYVAVHIRRTDKIISKINKIELTPEEDFLNFLKNTNYNIFLATDCFHIQNKFKEEFGNRLFWLEKIKKPWAYGIEDCETYGLNSCPDFRPTSLESTTVDLFTCIYSNNFMGTNVSGMSQFIEYNRNFKNKIFI